jgi:hypothetical protein
VGKQRKKNVAQKLKDEVPKLPPIEMGERKKSESQKEIDEEEKVTKISLTCNRYKYYIE